MYFVLQRHMDGVSAFSGNSYVLILVPSCCSLTSKLSPYFNITLPSCWYYCFQQVVSNEHNSLDSSQIRKMALNHFWLQRFLLCKFWSHVRPGLLARSHHTAHSLCWGQSGKRLKTQQPSSLPTLLCWQECFQVTQFYTNFMHILQRCADCFSW